MRETPGEADDDQREQQHPNRAVQIEQGVLHPPLRQSEQYEADRSTSAAMDQCSRRATPV